MELAKSEITDESIVLMTNDGLYLLRQISVSSRFIGLHLPLPLHRIDLKLVLQLSVIRVHFLIFLLTTLPVFSFELPLIA